MAHLFVIDAIDDRDDWNDIDTVTPEILNRSQLHIEQITDRAMRIGSIADTVELQVGIT